jgi:hypothetical protein
LAEITLSFFMTVIEQLKKLLDDYKNTDYVGSLFEPTVLATLIAQYYHRQDPAAPENWMALLVHDLLQHVVSARKKNERYSESKLLAPRLIHNYETSLFWFMDVDEPMCHYIRADDSWVFLWGPQWAMNQIADTLKLEAPDATASDQEPNTEYRGELYWDDPTVGLRGTATTILMIEEDSRGNEDGALFVVVDLRWSQDAAPNGWNIHGGYEMNQLAAELPSFLYQYCPAPTQVLKTLLRSLPPELRKAFAEEV